MSSRRAANTAPSEGNRTLNFEYDPTSPDSTFRPFRAMLQSSLNNLAFLASRA
jgi:hypothetical protein